MCGLVGLIGRKPYGFNSFELDIFEQMLMIDTVRGKDSTGVMSVFRDRDVRVVKMAEEPYLLFRTKQWDALRGKTIVDGRFIMGHNRAATRGSVSNENAHPFVENHIILMHNGTLRGHKNLTDENVEVDSHAICHALTEGTPQEVIPKIKGAFALIWYNTQTEKLYATRNSERPLAMIETEDLYALVSEPWIGAMPLQRKGRTISQIVPIDEYQLFEWDLKGNLTISQLEKPAPEVITPITTTTSYGGRYRDIYEEYEDEHTPFVAGEATPPKQTPTEITNLRRALTSQAQEKEQRKTPTNSCALTLLKDTASTSPSKDNQPTNTINNASSESTPVGTTGPTAQVSIETEEERIESQQKAITVFNKEFIRGQEILVKIWQINRLPNGRLKFHGKVVHPGKEMVDCQGFMPTYLEPYNMAPQCAEWMKEIVLAKVGWYTQTTCGPSVFLTNTQRVPEVEIHAGDIPKPLWDHVTENCFCSECGIEIQDWENQHTHVKTKAAVGVKGHNHPLNEVTAVCAECLMRKLPEGDFYDKFVETYYEAKHSIGKFFTPKTHSAPTVQDREPVRTEPGGKDDRTPAVQGSPTVQ